MSVATRENWILREVLSGNVPDFLRTLVPVPFSGTINGTNHTGTYYAAPDYLAIGSDADYFLEPMSPLLAQRLCDALGCTLPTRKMVNQIWTNAPVKLAPFPYSPATYDILSVEVFALSNGSIRSQRAAQTNAHPLGALVSGDKKDVIISSRIYTNFATSVTKPVVIYGWHQLSGAPIQPLYNGHEETYADYSHGARLIQNAILLDGGPETITNLVRQPGLAALLSDDGASEGTTNGIIPLPRYTIAPAPPVILVQPRSQTVLPGASGSFRVLATGDGPLGYRWQFNGVNLPGATNDTLAVSNAQPAQAGNYTVVVTNTANTVTSRVARLRINSSGLPILFADNFETNSAANWNLFWGASNGIPDYTVDWTFDHSLVVSSFNGQQAPIPPAPNSADGSARAIRFTVNNNDATGSQAAINIYPRGQFFSGNFSLKFDLWVNYPGNAGGVGSGVTGSTEHAIFGLNHLGTQVNWAATSAPSSDGVWFGVDGEGGDSKDYRAYAGNPLGTQVDLVANGTSGLTASNNTAAIYQALFPAARFETAGAPGKTWVEVEVRQTNNMILWLLDGTLVAQRTNTSPFSSGNIMLGFMDTFPSIANPAADAFVLFDNVRVQDLGGRVRFLSVSKLAGGAAQVRFSAVPGRDYALQASMNLVDWLDIALASGTGGPITVTDLGSVGLDRRFYRVLDLGPSGN